MEMQSDKDSFMSVVLFVRSNNVTFALSVKESETKGQGKQVGMYVYNDDGGPLCV
jgi:hypothetical protein